MKLIITVSGCDDSTEVEGDFTLEEEHLLERVANAVTAAAEYGCQPVMHIGPWVEKDEYDKPRGEVAAQ